MGTLRPGDGAFVPLYEYECESCKKRFEVIQKFSDESLRVCTDCGGPANRLLSSAAFQFKGTGWYVTDYARKTAPAAASPGDAKGDGKGNESEKPAAASTETTKETKAPESAPPQTPSAGKD